MSVLVESVACTVDDARLAEQAGAGRIELVSAISEGGLTPSLGTFRAVRAACRIPIVVMIRPRGGGFVYTEGEFATMLEDARLFAEAGADGLVTGILTDKGRIHGPRIRDFVAQTPDTPVIFHRAFDLADPQDGVPTLIELAIARVLTSGRAVDALTGAPQLRAMREAAGDRLQILAGGGVRAPNAVEIVAQSGVDQIHLGPFMTSRDPWSGRAEWSSDVSRQGMMWHLALESPQVRAVVEAVKYRPQ